MQIQTKFQAWAFVLMIVIGSCKKDPEIAEDKQTLGPYEHGIFVINEGTFSDFRGGLDFISSDLKTIDLDIYVKTNGEEMGNVLRGAAIKDSLLYCVFNDSQKLVVSNRYTAKKIAETSVGLESPTTIVLNDKFIYVSNSEMLSPVSELAILERNSLALTRRISMPGYIPSMVMLNGILFVPNDRSSSNQISLIDSETNTVRGTSNLPKGRVVSMIGDNQNVYALTREWDENNAYIYTLDSGGKIIHQTKLSGMADAYELQVNKGKLYFTIGLDVYVVDAKAQQAPAKPLFTCSDFPKTRKYIDDLTIIDDRIFLSAYSPYEDDSQILIYDLNGKLLQSHSSGRGTVGFLKN
ncbi:DUF5074 domain-containing protein [Sphingobacterium deserti]|uniref:Lipoprotein n=1 Tax=Sphingobacterium deserti TaxID=1229276 RepID=A0A0B8T3L9_9SPHI|nr:DUF5074 domain-containing protein [Sphingobacterium deserti]KGE15766.1 hypothetical protein DI53_0544 [Sphingobacterium deserti]